MRPTTLTANRFERFYSGGRQIEAFRGLAPGHGRLPEDWVGSTVTAFGESLAGLTRLPDGRTLREAVLAEPEAFLGPDHRAAFGDDPLLLVKLLDAGERLPVHVHPNDEFARRHLGCPWGKTEAWVITSTPEGGGTVYLGFREDVDAATVRGWVARQQVDRLLGTMNAVPVHPGDGVLVPAGLPHAIDAGILLVELQQPTDLSVLLEWDGFAIDGSADGHLGLGFDLALGCVDRSAWPSERRARLYCPGAALTGRALPAAADRFFRAERVIVGPDADLSAGFAIVVTVQGRGRLRGEDWAVDVSRGSTLLLPHAAGASTVEGDGLEMIVARPPSPETLVADADAQTEVRCVAGGVPDPATA